MLGRVMWASATKELAPIGLRDNMIPKVPRSSIVDKCYSVPKAPKPTGFQGLVRLKIYTVQRFQGFKGASFLNGF